MGDRFYTQQLQTLGDCPGNKNPNRRTRKVAWDDDKAVDEEIISKLTGKAAQYFTTLLSNEE